ncbi:MAG: VanZ family protein [Thermoleophilia bacterium]
MTGAAPPRRRATMQRMSSHRPKTPPAPHPPEGPRSRWQRRLSLWLPPVVWLAVIAFTSGDVASQTTTEGSFLRLLSAWWPSLPTALQDATWWGAAGWTVRKAAHLTEYGVLAFLVLRAVWADTRLQADTRLRAESRLRGLAAPAGVFLFCGLVASGDELHQATVASRSGSLVDVGIDLLGAFLMIGALGLARRRRERRRG